MPHGTQTMLSGLTIIFIYYQLVQISFSVCPKYETWLRLDEVIAKACNFLLILVRVVSSRRRQGRGQTVDGSSFFSGGASYWRRAATKSLGTRKSGLVDRVNIDASRLLRRLGRRFLGASREGRRSVEDWG